EILRRLVQPLLADRRQVAADLGGVHLLVAGDLPLRHAAQVCRRHALAALEDRQPVAPRGAASPLRVHGLAVSRIFLNRVSFGALGLVSWGATRPKLLTSGATSRRRRARASRSSGAAARATTSARARPTSSSSRRLTSARTSASPSRPRRPATRSVTC